MIEYFVDSASSYAADIDFLFDMITVIIGFWFFLVQGVLFYFLFRYKRKEGVKGQYITGEEHQYNKWIHYPHYAVIICDVVLIAFTLNVWIDVKQNVPPIDEEIRVIGQQWTWIFVHPGADGKLDTADDKAVVNELHVKKDTTYRFHLESKDVLHSFSIPVFRLKQDAVPGRVISGWFTPTKTGEYDIQCAEMCGIGHGIMASRVFIESPEDHQKWLAKMSNEPTETVDSLAVNDTNASNRFPALLEQSFK